MSDASPSDPITRIIAAPECCGEPMLIITTDLDARLGALRFECSACGFLMLAVEEPCEAAAPTQPTGHAAGSEGKIEVMRARANKKEALFHAQDNRAGECAPDRRTGGASDAHIRRSASDLPAGVTWNKARGKYQARTSKRGARRYLGLFDDVASAVAAIAAALAREAGTQ